MTKILSAIWDFITLPFIAVAVLIDDSKRYNEDGSWDNYHAEKNAKETTK